ncbi:MAG: winged helix-turn-helix domain-containing protein [Candidatus Hadarchaeota archaeon]
MVERQEIRKIKQPPVFEKKTGWKEVESQEQAEIIHRALGDPIRATIYSLLDDGPIRQIDLARLVNKVMKTSYDVSAILHHLELLEKAGLAASVEFPGKQTKIKMIYRARDLKLQLYERPKIDAPPEDDDWRRER